MDQEAAVKWARFINRTVGLRESFYFAFPEQSIRAVQFKRISLRLKYQPGTDGGGDQAFWRNL